MVRERDGLLLKDKRFYVYVYLDPRKSGWFVYEEYEFEYEPFYRDLGRKTTRLVLVDELPLLNLRSFGEDKLYI